MSIPRKYRRILFTTIIYSAIGFIVNWLTIDTIKAILGQELSIVYISELISF